MQEEKDGGAGRRSHRTVFVDEELHN